MKLSILKPIASVCLSTLLIGLTGCQTAVLNNSHNMSNSSGAINTPVPAMTVEGASYGDGLFYSYPFKSSDLQDVYTMQAVGGKLVYREGCLQLFNGSKYVTPIFPNGVTTFDKQTQTLEMLQVTFHMQDMLMASGFQISSKDYLEESGYETVTQAPERCLLDTMMLLRGVPDNLGRMNDVF